MKRKHGKPPDGTAEAAEAPMIGYMVSAVVIAIVFQVMSQVERLYRRANGGRLVGDANKNNILSYTTLLQ